MKKIIVMTFFALSCVAYSQWYKVNNGLDSLPTTALVTSGNFIYAGTWGGIYLSTNGGVMWNSINNNLGIKHVFSLAVKDSMIFAGTSEEGLVISKDSGKTWKSSLKIEPYPNVVSILMHKTRLFVGTALHSAWLSTDTGKTWTDLKTNGFYCTGAYAFLSYKNSIYAGPATNSIYISTDDGENWKNRYQVGEIRSLAANSKSIFAGCLNLLYHSENEGIDWIGIIIQDHPMTRVYSLAVSGDNIFAGTDGSGVFLSTNNGRYWEQINSGLSSNTVNALTISGDEIYAGTWSGIFKAKLSDFGILNNKDNSIIGKEFSISPNPAGDFIEILLPVGAQCTVPEQIRIYNVFGEEVNLTPALSMLGEGENNPLNPPLIRGNLKIDISSLSPGLYFVRVGDKMQKFIKI